MKLTVALISLGSQSSKWTADAMRKYFEEVDEINIKDIEVNISSKDERVFVQGKPIKKYDCIYVKGSFRYAQLLRAITTELKGLCYMPFAPRAFTLAHDKLLTQLSLEQDNIPMPLTYMAATVSSAKKILEKIRYPVIMKLPQGTQGKGVMFADSYAAASSMLDTLDALKQPFIIQEYIETDNVDIRVLVVGDKVIAAMKRKGKGEEARANIHAGGKGEAYEPDSFTKKIAIKTAKALGAEILGVDMLESVKGPHVIEANISPGLQGITEATGINIADKIAKYLFNQTLNYKKKDSGDKKENVLSDLGIVNGDLEKKHEIIAKLDFRGEKILLPEIVTKLTKFSEDEEFVIEAKKDFLKIKKMETSDK
ncbi:RimK family alpha-L-glutamate ligase [Candidatus Woesearchaeota archaeon]|nr:RimK family alpha-L-glutamate ligase [Candidatus Woesearchaeota archaeon]